jgi:hypothetical protein
LNPWPHGPEPCALPGCATPRQSYLFNTRAGGMSIWRGRISGSPEASGRGAFGHDRTVYPLFWSLALLPNEWVKKQTDTDCHPWAGRDPGPYRTHWVLDSRLDSRLRENDKIFPDVGYKEALLWTALFDHPSIDSTHSFGRRPSFLFSDPSRGRGAGHLRRGRDVDGAFST